MRVDWRKALPPRGGWLRLLASPTSFVLAAGFLLTLHGKARILRNVDDIGFWPAALIWAGAMDALVYLAFAAMFAVGEGRSPWMRAATYPLTALIASLSLINAWYLSVTGEQLTWEAIQLGFDRWIDLWRIAGEAVLANKALSLLFALFLIGVPSAIRWQLRVRTGPWRPGEHDRERAHCAAVVAGFGLVLAILWPSPSSLAAQRIEGNAALRTYWDWLTDEEDDVIAGDLFDGYAVPTIVSGAEIAELSARTARGDAPNVLVIVLESTRFDHTSLAGNAGRGTKTPNLYALASRGTSALRARPVLPHTTKSLFAILCGRYPTMQLGIVEHAANLPVQCVPAIASAGGYRSAFFQSAWGNFEHRVRLIHKLGYQHFEAWEDIQGEMVGYLASDDQSLVDPVLRWLDDTAASGKPFFVTLLTSAAHHPYRLPSSVPANGASSDEERYARIVEVEDVIIGRVLDALAARGLLDDTIVVVMGDHGEGFGAKGVRQHDNNYYEEGLHVPLVFAGPGVPAAATIDANVTLADVAPTLLGLLRVDVTDERRRGLVGIDVLAGPVPDDRMLAFSCWYELRCRGFVTGNHKVVWVPQTGRGYYFDLVADPDESDVRPVPAALRERIPFANRMLDELQTRTWPIELGEVTSYPPWHCAAGRPCTHPNQQEFRLAGSDNR